MAVALRLNSLRSLPFPWSQRTASLHHDPAGGGVAAEAGIRRRYLANVPGPGRAGSCDSVTEVGQRFLEITAKLETMIPAQIAVRLSARSAP